MNMFTPKEIIESININPEMEPTETAQKLFFGISVDALREVRNKLFALANFAVTDERATLTQFISVMNNGAVLITKEMLNNILEESLDYVELQDLAYFAKDDFDPELTDNQEELIRKSASRFIDVDKVSDEDIENILNEYKETVREFLSEGLLFERESILRPRISWPALPTFEFNETKTAKEAEHVEELRLKNKELTKKFEDIEHFFMAK